MIIICQSPLVIWQWLWPFSKNIDLSSSLIELSFLTFNVFVNVIMYHWFISCNHCRSAVRFLPKMTSLVSSHYNIDRTHWLLDNEQYPLLHDHWFFNGFYVVIIKLLLVVILSFCGNWSFVNSDLPLSVVIKTLYRSIDALIITHDHWHPWSLFVNWQRWWSLGHKH